MPTANEYSRIIGVFRKFKRTNCCCPGARDPWKHESKERRKGHSAESAVQHPADNAFTAFIAKRSSRTLPNIYWRIDETNHNLFASQFHWINGVYTFRVLPSHSLSSVCTGKDLDGASLSNCKNCATFGW